MLSGDTLWNDEVTAGLTEVTLYGRTVRTYAGAPHSLYHTLARTAERFGEKVAIYAEDSNRFTFADVKRYVDNFAAFLHCEHGIGRGDRVGVLLDNGIDFVTAFYSVNRLGAMIVPLPGKFRKNEILALIQQADVKLVICQKEQAGWFADIPTLTTNSTSCAFGLLETELAGEHTARWAAALTDYPLPTWEDDAILLFTSGTTSQSKGVVLTNLNAIHAIISYERTLALTSEDTTIIAVPIYHVTGMIAIIGLFIYLGGSIHVQKRMSGRPFVREIAASEISFIHASPTVFALMLEERDRFPELPSVQKMACGAAHMPVSRILALHEWMPQMQFRTVYGLTESCSPAFVFPVDAATSKHLGSSGMPIPGLDVQIRNDSGEEVPEGSSGEIWMRGANIARCYDKLTTPAMTGDGWLGTGDIGRIDPDGYISILDRKKDMINRGGEKIWCFDIEEELRRLPEIADASLVGVRDAVYGEVPAAAVVLTPGAVFDREEVREQLNLRLARYQVPVYFRVLEELPTTAGSKIDKRAIRELFAEENG
ncbi:class I adenylate-forming enzyme family protein [Trueperella sp. LYQ143]|uniref:class I adenylate-forming enzyme family protein n=1 Tax=Trueperella sp. LYQ143 TaxID=3391059 RepID=UPI0039831EAC